MLKPQRVCISGCNWDHRSIGVVCIVVGLLLIKQTAIMY